MTKVTAPTPNSKRWKQDAVGFDRQYEKPGLVLAGVSNVLKKRMEKSVDLINTLPQKPQVLEIGCGVGRLCLNLAARGFTCTGLDISQEAVQQARAEAERLGLGLMVNFRELDITSEVELPKADVWVALGVLDYFANPERVLSKLNSIPRFIFTIPRKGHPLNIPRFAFRTIFHGERFWTYTREEIENLLAQNNLRATAIEKLSTMWFIHNI
jgi:SAM-dependent methyltransferase